MESLGIDFHIDFLCSKVFGHAPDQPLIAQSEKEKIYRNCSPAALSTDYRAIPKQHFSKFYKSDISFPPQGTGES